MDFVHLMVESEYSLLNSYVKLEELFERLKKYGYTSVAILDYKTSFGMMHAHNLAKKFDIKLIYGMKFVINSSDESFILPIIIKNENGYKNFLKLNSVSYKNSETKPYITFENLLKYKDGLILIDGYFGTKLFSISQNPEFKVKNYLESMAKFFKNDYYIAISSGLTATRDAISLILEDYAKKHNITTVASNEVYYIDSEDLKFLEILHCIKNGVNINERKNSDLYNGEFYLRDKDEILELFKGREYLIKNTLEISNKCNFDFDFTKNYLPKFLDINDNVYNHFKALCYNGFSKRYGKDALKNSKLVNRLELEMGIIKKMDFIHYFLIVSDFVRFAKNNNIEVGDGRGSAGGSIVSYVLYITEIDPVKYNLIFERFLNPERVSMPDIDIDFEHTRRKEVINFVVDKYGKQNVSNVGTFITLGARSAIDDVGRVLAEEKKVIDSIKKFIPNELNITLDDALLKSKNLKELYDNDVNSYNLINLAKKIEGMPRNLSTHAAGLIITENPVSELTPTYVQSGNYITQFEKKPIEKLGFLKMDFLGLTNLTVISDCIKFIEKNGKNLDEKAFILDMNDKKTFEMLSRGYTKGVFQLESDGLTNFLKKLKPKSVEDIVVALSIYRPGPMDSIPIYLKNRYNGVYKKRGIKIVDDILKPTYGCMIYQEQVMQIATELAGFSYAKADIIRRAMSDKNESVLENERSDFINGALKNSVSKDNANELFEEMLKFSKYAFNKSHAVGYAYTSYKTAYLKANFSSEFFSALFSNFDKKSSIESYIDEMKVFSVGMLRPCINKSKVKFSPENGDVRYGLYCIKNVGIKSAEILVKIAESFNFEKSSESFVEFIKLCADNGINKKCFESLITAGVLDVFGLNRNSMVLNLDDIIMYSKKNNIPKNQLTFFDMENLDVSVESYKFNYYKEYDKIYLRNIEKELLGTSKFKVNKTIWILLDKLSNDDKKFLKSQKVYGLGHKVCIVDSSGVKIVYKDKIYVDDRILSKFIDRYKKENVKIIEEL